MVNTENNNTDSIIINEFSDLCKLVRGSAVKSNNGRKIFVFTQANGERNDEYVMNGLYKVFYNMAEDVFNQDFLELTLSQRENRLFDMFNQKFKNCHNNYVFEKSEYEDGSVVTFDNTLFAGLFLSTESKKIASSLVDSFNENYKRIRKFQDDMVGCFLDQNLVDNYLDSYLELCKFIFKPTCLHQEELRSLKIIEKILNVDYNREKECFGLYSPFVVFAILRTLKYIAALPDDVKNDNLPEDCTELNSRKHILATYAIRSFSRFTIINKESCVVEYSRRNDKIICKEVQKVSSMDNVKPIRLFEKITSYIYNYFKDFPNEKNKDFLVSVYGFCWFDTKENPNPAEIDDLIYEIYSWFEDKRKYDIVLKDKMISHLTLNYYLMSDNNNEEEITIPFVYRYTEDKLEGVDNSGATYNCDFNIFINRYESYNNQQMSEVIEESDIIFILDCPWLATEDFNLDTEGDFNLYSRWFETASYKRDLNHLFSSQPRHSGFFDRVHLFASINDQFSRLAVNNKQRYGKVVRVMKDYLLNWIQQQIELYKANGIYKSIYIYNSSLRGMAYSNYALYPIIREESYSNKRFTIMKFSTRDNNSVPQQLNDKVFISLWSLLKYVDISFAFVGIKDWFTKKFYPMIKNVDGRETQEQVIMRDIVSILRNIVFVLDYSKNDNKPIRDIKIKISLSKPVREKYFGYQSKDSINSLIKFFEKILREIIFKNSTGLGDCCIREAFERCLYNQAKSANDLFLLHLYSIKKENQSLSYFNVSFNSSDLSVEDFAVDNLVKNFDSFSDKRAYQKLYDYLDVLNSSEYAVRSLLNQVDKIFKKEYLYTESHDHSYEILCNIKEICEKNSYTQSYLYKNVMNYFN